MIIELNAFELNILVEKLLNSLLSGLDLFSKKGAFKEIEKYELVGEPFCTGNEDFFDRLIKVINNKNSECFYCLRYEINEDELNIHEGYEVKNDTTYWEYHEVGNKLLYTINGTRFIFLDQSLTWCIMTVVDCQFIFGDIKFISSYFENEEEKKEIISIFQEFLNEPDRQTTFKNLNRFIRLIP